MPARLYVVGRLRLESPTSVVEQQHLRGRKARVLLVALAWSRTHPVSREALAERLWDGQLPAAWESSLDALVSNIRHAVVRAFPDGSATVRTTGGCHQLVLPADTVVDAETAVRRMDAAEGAVRRGDLRAAWADATVAGAIARRPLLSGEDGRWVVQTRRELAEVLLRSFSCVHTVWSARGDHEMAARMARTCVSLAPFRETGYRQLMTSLAATGDHAEALRVYEQCRRLLAEELGTDPSPQTRAVYRLVLRGGSPDPDHVQSRRT